MENTTEILKNLGFEEREIKIYLNLIKQNSLTALQIAKRTRIDRTTVYDILERLIDKGIVSLTTKNKTKHFTALNPKELLLYFKEKYNSLANIIVELNKISNHKTETVKCEFYQGKEGLKTVLKELIESKKDYKAIGIRKEYEEILGYFNEQGVLNLNKFNVKETAIVERSSSFKRLKKGEYRYLDKKLISPCTVVIFGNKVIFFIWQEPYFAVLVENKDFAKSQEEYFELLWKIGKR